MKFLDRLQPFALLALRVVLGVILVAHGYSKVFGGFSKHAQTVSGLGFPHWLAYFSTATEFVGGILLIAGLLTRFVSIAVVIEMLVAIFKVHLKNGLIGQNRSGYEFPLCLAVMAFSLIIFGGGPFGLDWLIRRR